MAVAKNIGEEVTVYATGNAARATVCALAISEDVKTAKIDKSALQVNGEKEYMEKFNIPGICLLGGLKEIVKLSKCKIELI